MRKFSRLFRIAFCGKCGDVLTRKTWYPHPDKVPVYVWACATRMQHGPKTCDLRYIYEEELQKITVQAINRAKGDHKLNGDLAEQCISEALGEEQDAKIAELDVQIRQLQDNLLFLKSGSNEIDELGNKIISLRDEKNKLLEEKALQAQRAKDIRACAEVFDGMTAPLESFEEKYVRSLISRINLFDDRVVFIFKDGQEIVIEE